VIQSFSLENYSPISSLQWENCQNINLIIGENGQGKTILLKALYSAIRSVEDYRKGDDPRKLNDILADKMYWTFQLAKLGDLQSKNANGKLRFEVSLSEGTIGYSFTEKTTTTIVDVSEQLNAKREALSIFLPAKEVLSLFNIIKKTREDKLFGFDDTYLDLVNALSRPTQRGRNYATFSTSRSLLDQMLDGRVEYDDRTGNWSYKRNRYSYSIQTTSEGVKKIAILDTLLGNRYLTPKSVVFIDEPESALHPALLSQFMDIIANLAGEGIQFFIASHSYFVIKKLLLISKEKGLSVPVLSMEKEGNNFSDLANGMPDNQIIDESIKLYEQEVELALKS
jgi:AAA15 family ATPase/GTPase